MKVLILYNDHCSEKKSISAHVSRESWKGSVSQAQVRNRPMKIIVRPTDNFLLWFKSNLPKKGFERFSCLTNVLMNQKPEQEKKNRKNPDTTNSLHFFFFDLKCIVS